jgi:hypothetical protein
VDDVKTGLQRSTGRPQTHVLCETSAVAQFGVFLRLDLGFGRRQSSQIGGLEVMRAAEMVETFLSCMSVPHREPVLVASLPAVMWTWRGQGA